MVRCGNLCPRIPSPVRAFCGSKGDGIMPRGAYTNKQERKADHIEKGYEKSGVSKKEAESRAWATVNKQDKGGKNDGSGRTRSRSAAAKKGWETRRRRGHN
jgi:plasmid stabilization system protein ParE